MYCAIYGSEAVSHVPLRFEEFSEIEVFGKLYTSIKSRSNRSAVVMGVWPDLNGRIIVTTKTSELAKLNFLYLTVQASLQFLTNLTFLAKIRWYQDHPRKFWLKAQ